jgi:hypothetical protein
VTDSMRAVGFRENLSADDPASLVDLRMPIPAPGPHDLLVRIHAASVNPVDTKIRRFSRTQDRELRILGFERSGSCSPGRSSCVRPSVLSMTSSVSISTFALPSG